MPEINIKKIRFVTLYTGEKGPNECVCNCPLCSERARKSSNYQGTEAQIDELLENLNSLKQLYILGNPDPAVDTSFCNLVAQKAIKKNIHVCFSTSGVGGANMLQKLLEGISPNMVDYISFSIDSVNPEKMSMLKGIKYPYKTAIEGINWAIENGYTVKIQPTLWSSNYMEVSKIIDFFVSIGVKWFSFHIGSLEAGINLPTHKHLQPKEQDIVLKEIDKAVKRYPDLKARCPVIFPILGENDNSKWYCMNPERCIELLVYFTANGILCTNEPIASKFIKGIGFMLGNSTDIVKVNGIKNLCALTKQLSGREDTFCRYVSKTWNY